MKINNFRGEYFFLSNFYPISIIFNGITFQNSEAAFQSQKTMNIDEQRRFANFDGKQAKNEGRKILTCLDWNNIKDKVMYDVVKEKFLQNPDLMNKLIATGDAYLEEGNNWGDRYWGCVNGVGKNKLGEILMEVRDELRKEEDFYDERYDDEEYMRSLCGDYNIDLIIEYTVWN